MVNTPTRRSRTAVLAMLALMIALVGVQAPSATASPGGTLADVVVRGSDMADVTAAVTRLGGVVTRDLDIIDGVAATMTTEAAEALALTPGIVSVTPDARLDLAQATSTYDASTDVTSMRTTLDVIDAEQYWAQGVTGRGVGVALIDTGVVPVEGLDDQGQVWYGPDLSFESINPNLRNLDTFGHGTHMAGLIMGRDTGASPSTFATRPRDFMGVAPDAHLISVKVADAYGATDVSQVIAAIDWVVQHRNDPQLNIRVMNLSFGVHSQQSYVVDPLVHAAEVAWDNGIVVVAAAGNDGDRVKGLTSPAYSPTLLSVGAVHTNQSTRYSHWTPLSFSGRGDGSRNPDILAPGKSIVGLRAPGSYLDVHHGQQAVVGERFFRGSGTSQAAAIMSGAAALLVSQHPDWTPAMVKAALLDNAVGMRPGAGFTSETGNRAVSLNNIWRAAPARVRQNTVRSTGGGSLDAARGTHRLELDGVVLQGEIDIFGRPVDTAALAKAERNTAAWNGGTWNGTQWSGTQWSGTQWSGTQWSGTTWSGTQWSGTQWSGTQWSGTQWSGTQWSGGEWR